MVSLHPLPSRQFYLLAPFSHAGLLVQSHTQLLLTLVVHLELSAVDHIRSDILHTIVGIVAWEVHIKSPHFILVS